MGRPEWGVGWVERPRAFSDRSSFGLSRSETTEVAIGTIGIVGGAGVIGRALVQAILAQEIVRPGDLIISARASAPPDRPAGVRYTSDNAWLASESEVVILSVRPEQFPSVWMDARDCLLISVMAGVPASVLTEKTKAVRVIRAMPNAAAGIGRSYTPFYANPAVGSDEKKWVARIFNAVGKSAEVQSEAELDYMTGLTGSGPAFVALLAEAMLAHAIAHGLESEFALEAVRAAIAGAAELVGGGALTPHEIVENLMDYRGSTAAALEAMKIKGFDSVVALGLEAAENRVSTMCSAS